MSGRCAVPAWAAYGGVALLVAAVCMFQMGIPGPVPLVYETDGLWNLFVIKAVVEEGWYYDSVRLGAPFGTNLTDFAKPETLFLALYALAGRFIGDPVLIHNLFYFAGFIAVAGAAQWVLWRELRLPAPLAATGAILFTFLPYHLLRVGHLFLSFYLAVPLAVWLMLRVAGHAPPFFERGRLSRPGWPVVVAVLVVSSTSIYYAFFGQLLIACAGLLTALGRREGRPLLSALLVCALVGGITLVNLGPSLLHRMEAGRNPLVAMRALPETELYALKPIQLLLPVAEHRSALLAASARAYERQVPVTEGRTSALGLIGVAGFMLLLLRLLLAGNWRARAPPLVLAQANAVALLFGVSGGFGTLMGLWVSPQLRALNRLSVFIGFLAISALLMGVATLLRRRFGLRRGPVVVAAVLLLALGLWDQLPPPQPAAKRLAAAQEYRADAAFFGRIEAALPAGAAVYQFPYTPFPEAPPQYHEPSYSHLRAYLHTTRLRFSYGAMKARDADRWHHALAAMPAEAQLGIIEAAGFQGVYLDRRALADGGEALESLLQARADMRLERDDGALVFYRLAGAQFPPHVPPLIELGEGFFPWEGDGAGYWAWSGGDGEVWIINPEPRAVETTFSATITALTPRTVTLGLAGRTVAEFEPPLWPDTIPLSLPMTVPRGVSRLTVASSAPPATEPGATQRQLAVMLGRPWLRPSHTVRMP